MKTGADQVLDRIRIALQDEPGIHTESLLTCLGALAGYACQMCVRQTAALPGADRRKFVLRDIKTHDGQTLVYGDALNAPLAESPLSVWALISGAVQKLDQAPPDMEDIFRHVTKTVGTSEFGVPRVPVGHRPSRRPALAYLNEIWPQMLPIAQKFCDKPVQFPVLFGIAIQRAIEQSKDILNPTLSARIAMESAVAMSKVVLTIAPATPASTPSIRLTSAAKRRSAASEKPSPPTMLSALADMPPGPRMVTIVLLGVITLGGAIWQTDRRQTRETERLAQELEAQKFQEGIERAGQIATNSRCGRFDSSALPAASCEERKPE